MKLHESIDGRLRAFIEAQRMFFVATAPLAADGHVNVSPKGVDGTFLVVDEHTVAYLDLTGSGAETVAHLRENGRITLMFCAFEGPPNIVRLHGTGRHLRPGDDEFDAWAGRFDVDLPGVRGLVVVDVERVSDSCGFAVPRYEYTAQRDLLTSWADKRGPAGLVSYRSQKNATSIDGLPALDPEPETA
jgi:hypothetical protein